MIAKVREKEKALELRKKGYSYADILKEIPVAKSSLSLWLKDVPLTESEKAVLKRRKDANISRGRIRASSANRMRRVVIEGFEQKDARKMFELHKHDSLFLLGIGLYWAEGAKRNSYFAFMNSDPDMINLMLLWIEKYLGISKEDVGLRLFVHKAYRDEHNEEFWAKYTGYGLEHFKKTILKPGTALVKRRPNYKGCIRIEVTKVKYLRKMKYWQRCLIEHFQK